MLYIRAPVTRAPDTVTGVSSFTASGNLDPAAWSALFSANGINTPGQFGMFDIAGVTGPNFNGGSPNGGIDSAGGSGLFTLGISGTGLNTLTAASFLNLQSEQTGKNGTPSNFAARYQATGPYGQGSDVAISTTSSTSSTTSSGSVPEPAPLALIGLALAFMGTRRFRRG